MTRPPGDGAALTVESLVRDTGLELRAGRGAATRTVRWVHTTELPDPTPWLSGGELVLTTGMQLQTPDTQRAFVGRLARHGLAGLGFGTGFDHGELPDALLEEARRLEFPLFEVPYETPFIALTERAFTTIVNAGYERLRRGAEIHRRLERLVLEERGLDEVVRALATAIDGAVSVLDHRGEPVASSAPWRDLPADVLDATRAALALGDPEPSLSGAALALPVATGAGAAPQAWVVASARWEGGPVGAASDDRSPAAGDRGGEPVLGDFERLILQQAVTVVALELMRLRVARDTERRLAGDVLAEALSGGAEPEELRRRLRPFGIASDAAVAVFSLDDPAAGEPVLDRVAADARCGALVATRQDLLCAVLDASAADPSELAARAREQLADKVGPSRAAVSRAAPVAALRRSFHEARCALEATAIENGDAPEVASWRDLGAFQLLLSLQDDEALRLYCDTLLEPLESSGGDYGGELVRSLEAFIEHNGQWESAARELYCHRHTLRYRMGRVEELTGRDLGRAQDRIEFWLALRGRELVR